MRFRQITIERFGIWRDWCSGELSSGLAVFFGPNETGKSTLLEFLRGMFFGFQQRTTFASPTEPTLAGEVICEHQGTLYRVQRSWTAQSGENVRVLNGSHSLPSEELLRLLCPFDEATFNSVFAINLEDIAHLRSLESGASGALLYELSLGTERAVLGRAFARLHQVERAIAEGDLLRTWEEEKARLRHELEQSDSIVIRFARLLAAQQAAQQQCGEAQQLLTRWEEECRVWEALREHLPLWEELRALEERLQELGEIQNIPVAFFRRLARRRHALQNCRERLETFQERLSRLRQQLCELPVNRAILAHASELEALRAVREEIGGLESELASLTAEGDRCLHELAAVQERLGLAERDLPARPLNAPLIAGIADRSPTDTRLTGMSFHGLKRAIRHWEHLAEQLHGQQEKVETRRREKEVLSQQLDAKLEKCFGTTVTRALEECSRLATLLRKVAQIKEHLESLDTRQKELRAERAALMREAAPSARTWLFVGVPFVLGIILTLLSLVVLVLFPTSTLGWSGVLFGGFLVTAGMAVKLQGDRLHRFRTQALLQEWEAFRAEKERLTEQLKAVEAALESAPAYLPRDLSVLEMLIRELEAAGLLQSRLDELGQQLAQEERRLGQVQTRHDKALARVAKFFAQLGLSAPQSAAEARFLYGLLRQYGHLQRRCAVLEKKRSSLLRQREAWAARIRELTEASGIHVGEDSPQAALDVLLAAYEQSIAAARQRKQILGEAKSLLRKSRQEKTRLQEIRNSLARQIQKLKHRAGSSASISEVHRRWQQARELKQRQEELTTSLRQAVHSVYPELLANQTLEDVFANLEARYQAARARVEEYSAQIQFHQQSLQRLSAEIEALVADRSTEEKRLALAALEHKLGPESLRRFVPRLTIFLFQRIRQRYEKERQPRILQLASEYFASLTEGRYRRVWTPLSERVLLAEDQTGAHRRVEELSRGTREQLFLALRLALATDWATRSTAAPLILDDVLVNFDQERVRAACRTLAQFASSPQQVLLLTCHEHIVRVCEDLAIPVTVLTPNANNSRSPRRGGRPSSKRNSPLPAGKGGQPKSTLAEANSADNPDNQTAAIPAAAPPMASAETPSSHRPGKLSQPPPEQTGEGKPHGAQSPNSQSFSWKNHDNSSTTASAAWIWVPDPYPPFADEIPAGQRDEQRAAELRAADSVPKRSEKARAA